MEYVFPGAYGGAVKSESPPQIHALIGKLRRQVGNLAAKKQAGGPMFAVRSAKELAQKLAEALDALDMVAFPVAQEVTHLPISDVPMNVNGKGTNPVFRTLTHVKTTVRVVAPDTSYMDCVGSGHGGDVDDKAGGKADTYSWKNALLKGLTIPDSEMADTDDEAPSADRNGPASQSSNRAPAKPASSANSGPADAIAAGNNGGPGPSGDSETIPESAAGLDYVLGRIAKADTDGALEDIKSAIVKGTLALHGADRLKASAAWTQKKEALKKSKSASE